MVFEINFEMLSSSTSYLEYQAGGGKGLVDLVNQLTLERCHSFDKTFDSHVGWFPCA